MEIVIEQKFASSAFAQFVCCPLPIEIANYEWKK
jgi:hypothetical protein